MTFARKRCEEKKNREGKKNKLTAARLQQCWFSDGICSVFCGLRIVLEHFMFGHVCKKTGYESGCHK